RIARTPSDMLRASACASAHGCYSKLPMPGRWPRQVGEFDWWFILRNGPAGIEAAMVRGEVVYRYAFDGAKEVTASQIKQVLGLKPRSFEIRVDRTTPKDVPLYKPLAIEPKLAVQVHGQAVNILIRIYDVGVVSVTAHVPYCVARLGDLVPFHNPKLESGESLDALARRLCVDVCQSIRPYLIRSSVPSEPEAYTIFCCTDLDGAQDTGAWLRSERRNIAGLLTETDPEVLSDIQVEEALRLQRSFEKTDLVMIDWDAALVVDLT